MNTFCFRNAGARREDAWPPEDGVMLRGRRSFRIFRRLNRVEGLRKNMSRQYAPSLESDTLADEEADKPRLYRVLLHNDDYTTMEFVVVILMEVFRKSAEQATAIMLSVHSKGVGVAGVYPLELAETKVDVVHARAAEAKFPLRCTLQEVDT